MKKLLENLKEAINLYEKCEDIDSDEYTKLENLQILHRCCKEVSEECQVMFNRIFRGE